MNSNFIQNACMDDFDSIYLLLEQLWINDKLDKKQLLNVYELSIKNKNEFSVCYVKDNDIIGFAAGNIQNAFYRAGNLCYVSVLIVDFVYRGQGVGKMLMDYIKEIAAYNNCKAIELESGFYREEAHTFYEKYGFKKTAYTDERIIGAINTLKLTSREEVTFTNYKSVQFIDCGEGLERLFCPWCGGELDIRYWQEAMDKAYVGNSFGYLGLRMPCCNLSSSLEELIYIKPCGFATFVIEVHNPTDIPCVIELHEMGKCFGHVNFFRTISVRI